MKSIKLIIIIILILLILLVIYITCKKSANSENFINKTDTTATTTATTDANTDATTDTAKTIENLRKSQKLISSKDYIDQVNKINTEFNKKLPKTVFVHEKSKYNTFEECVNDNNTPASCRSKMLLKCMYHTKNIDYCMQEVAPTINPSISRRIPSNAFNSGISK